LTQYRHVMGGICFRCWGAGIEPYTPDEIEAWLVKARKEYKARKTALETASGKRAYHLKAELQLLETMGKRARARLEKVRGIRRRKSQSRSDLHGEATTSIRKRPSTATQRRPVAEFQSYSSDEVYGIYEAQDDGSLYCTCKAWKYQRKHPKDRTCKHIEQFKATRNRRRSSVEGDQLSLLQ